MSISTIVWSWSIKYIVADIIFQDSHQLLVFNEKQSYYFQVFWLCDEWDETAILTLHTRQKRGHLQTQETHTKKERWNLQNNNLGSRTLHSHLLWSPYKPHTMLPLCKIIQIPISSPSLSIQPPRWISRLVSSTTGFEWETNFVSCFLETLSINWCTDSDFDAWTEGLDVWYCCNTRIVDLALINVSVFLLENVRVPWRKCLCRGGILRLLRERRLQSWLLDRN